MPKNKTKTEIKKLLNQVDYLSKEEKAAWLEIVETLDQEQLDEVFDHFDKQIKKENDIRLKLIVKHGKEKKYLSEVVKISKKYYAKAKKHKK